MSELKPGGRELIESARRERTPSREARARVLASVLANAGGAGATTPENAPKTAATASVMKASLAKSVLMVALAAAGMTSTYVGLRRPSSGPEERPSMNEPAVASAREQTPAFRAAAPELDAPAPSSSVVSAPSHTANAEKRSAAPASSASAGGLERELSLLQRAHVAYRTGQPALALQLAREHANTFPHSQLAAEEQTIQVLSLCALGRTQDARALADRLRAGSASPALGGLAGSCVSR